MLKKTSLILTINKADHFLFLEKVVENSKRMTDNEETSVCTQVIACLSDEACDCVGCGASQNKEKQSCGGFFFVFFLTMGKPRLLLPC